MRRIPFSKFRPGERTPPQERQRDKGKQWKMADPEASRIFLVGPMLLTYLGPLHSSGRVKEGKH
jgi:hypothetical protein